MKRKVNPLRRRTHEEWKQIIGKIRRRNTRIAIANIIWWDVFADKNKTATDPFIVQYKELWKAELPFDYGDIERVLLAMGYGRKEVRMRIKAMKV